MPEFHALTWIDGKQDPESTLLTFQSRRERSAYFPCSPQWVVPISSGRAQRYLRAGTPRFYVQQTETIPPAFLRSPNRTDLPLAPAELAESIECLNAYTLDMAQQGVEPEDRPKLDRLNAACARVEAAATDRAATLPGPARTHQLGTIHHAH